jgi:hypothetical protein
MTVPQDESESPEARHRAADQCQAKQMEPKNPVTSRLRFAAPRRS